MKDIKSYLRKDFEQVFVLVILVSVIVINYFLPYKIAFLNFYYLPIMLSGYFLGKRASVKGSLLCILVVVIFGILSPDSFYMAKGNLNVALNLVTWASFLLLAGIAVGTLQEKLVDEYECASQLNKELQDSHAELEKTNHKLKETNSTLEQKASELEEKKSAVENLQEKMEKTLFSTMDSSVAKLIIQGRLRNEKKNISVLFSDLVKFTNFAEKNRPETVLEKLNSFLAHMEPIITDYRGHIDKYMGDRIMCEFGAPNDYDTHSLLAVLAGIKMQEKLLQSDFPWQMRIGIGSGSAITGLIGFKRQTYTAVGDAVNVASRLEEICPPTRVVIDDETYQNVKDFINVERVKNFGQGLKRQEDFELLEKIEANKVHLKTNPKDSEALVETGKIYFQLMQVSEAIECFEKAHALEPDNAEIKLLYADASLKKDEFEKIRIRGKKDRIPVYKVTGIKDIMQDRKRILDGFYQKYKYVEELIEVTEDVILPVEALDGSIGHSKAVAIISYAIADCLGLTEQEKRNILVAGYLQDIGKQIVSPHILNRKGSLSETEKIEIEEHPIEGSKILKSNGYHTEDILEIVLHHHERYDGEGYPFKKRGNRIPLGARITGLADSYNALISWRPYREGWEQKTALGEIQKGTNEGKFDPQLSDILIDLLS